MTKELPDRFWAKVDKTETCWLWMGVPNSRGYGLMSIDGIRQYAHRLSLEAVTGPLPAGAVVDHKCRVKLCVRPDHLQVVDTRLNSQNRLGAQSNSQSGVRGVFPHRGRWRVQVKAPDGKIHSGGVFDTIEAADVAAHNLRMDLMTNNLADDANADE